ncbi:MAG: hypothetical protein QOJ91_606 [Sphingomonadales bacterium]|jgi:hypothetical protein|nr:hypothetical protein [Sphingomonadales bacterium]
MNIVELLEEAVKDLPSGEYSVGLNAIVRHVKAAIRHLERDKAFDPDTCTDAIYRMNQAYEGSLKEAYRVLAEKDPSGLSPFQIEGYLETHNIVRPRVLTQLTRYRQDYRNPSTHDYKLDFDEDEALLAIVSVCAFAKLLINQIKSKLASEAAQARAVPSASQSSRASLRSQGDRIARICLAYTNESSEVGWFEYERGLADSLKAAGFTAEAIDQAAIIASKGHADPWDVVIRKGKSIFGINARISRHARSDLELHRGSYFTTAVKSSNCSGGLLILRSEGQLDFQLHKGTVGTTPVYVITEHDEEQIDALSQDFSTLKQIT